MYVEFNCKVANKPILILSYSLMKTHYPRLEDIRSQGNDTRFVKTPFIVIPFYKAMYSIQMYSYSVLPMLVSTCISKRSTNMTFIVRPNNDCSNVHILASCDALFVNNNPFLTDVAGVI